MVVRTLIQVSGSYQTAQLMLCVSLCVWVPFAPLSHDSCCTSSRFCFVWSVCGLALRAVNAVLLPLPQSQFSQQFRWAPCLYIHVKLTVSLHCWLWLQQWLLRTIPALCFCLSGLSTELSQRIFSYLPSYWRTYLQYFYLHFNIFLVKNMHLFYVDKESESSEFKAVNVDDTWNMTTKI